MGVGYLFQRGVHKALQILSQGGRFVLQGFGQILQAGHLLRAEAVDAYLAAVVEVEEGAVHDGLLRDRQRPAQQ